VRAQTEADAVHAGWIDLVGAQKLCEQVARYLHVADSPPVVREHGTASVRQLLKSQKSLLTSKISKCEQSNQPTFQSRTTMHSFSASAVFSISSIIFFTQSQRFVMFHVSENPCTMNLVSFFCRLSQMVASWSLALVW